MVWASCWSWASAGLAWTVAGSRPSKSFWRALASSAVSILSMSPSPNSPACSRIFAWISSGRSAIARVLAN